MRAEGFVFSHVGDEGWMDSCAGDLLRYRRIIAADNVLVFTDIKKKHRCVCVCVCVCETYICIHKLPMHVPSFSA